MPTRRRKGNASRSTTPTPSEKASDTTTEEHDDGDDNDRLEVDGDGKEMDPASDKESNRVDPMNAAEKGTKKDSANEETKESDGTVKDPASLPKQQEEDLPQLVLTSEKRQNIYECDYCHQDISQQPRIRCAVCADFDLCLDCFATSDHQAMIARIQAASHTQNELNKDGIDSTSMIGVAISSAAANHDSSHGYRVCDSTRYPVFATGRVLPTGTPSAAGAASVKSAASGVSKGSTNESDDKMEVDSDQDGGGEEVAKSTVSSTYAPSSMDAISVVSEVALSEDPKFVWTVEEDLRLIDAIRTHGLGNWPDISEAISGNGSVGKTPKRCMERFFDDFLGRYGHILPPWTAVGDDHGGVEDDEDQDKGSEEETSAAADAATVLSTPAKTTVADEEEFVRSSKRQRTSTGRMSTGLLAQTPLAGNRSKKKLKVVPTDSLPDYEKVWPKPYIPPTGVEVGQEVARDLASKAELAFVKSSLAASSKAEADKIRKDWEDNRLGQIGSPTVLPPRPEDAVHLPGSELAGFMPRRGDFDVEWGNDAEQSLADMEFTRADTPEERQLKMQVLDIYCQKLDEREKRKDFILSRHLYDYRKYMEDDQKLPQDERDLVSRMRMFERFHTPEEHKQFITDILKAKRLRKEIAKLQMYRRIGIRSLAEAEKYELDKNRRQFHKMAQMQREADAKTKGAMSSAISASKQGISTASTYEQSQRVSTDSLWKKYRSSDRKARRHSNRSGILVDGSTQANTKSTEETKETLENDNLATEKKGEDGDAPKDETPKEESVDDELEKETPKDAQKPSEDEDEEFDISRSRGVELLSKKEVNLCKSLKLYPIQYLEIKKALIHETLMKGMLDGPTGSHGRRTIVKIDVVRRGNVIDFMVRAGWISRKLGDAAMRVVTPPPLQEPETNQTEEPPTKQETAMETE